MKQTPPRIVPFHSLFAAAGIFLATVLSSSAQILWNFATDTPTSGVPANLTVGAIAQGNNNGTTALLSSSSVSSGYAGASGAGNAGAAARTGPLLLEESGSTWFEVTLTPATGYLVSLTGFSAGTRRTSTGPQKYTLRTSADNFTSDVVAGDMPAATTWGLLTHPALAVSVQAPLTLRLYGHDGTGSPGTGTANWRIDDLSLTVSVGLVTGQPPAITGFTPSNGGPGTLVTLTGTNFGTSPTVTFNGTPAPGATANAAGTSITVSSPNGATTGPISVVTNNGSATSAASFTIPVLPQLEIAPDATTFAENSTVLATVTRPADAPGGNSPLTVSLTSSNPLKATVPASVIIPASQLAQTFTVTGVPDHQFGSAANVILTATAAGYTNGTTSLTVSNIDPPPASNQTVVINKLLNVTPDLVELLVTGNGTAGTTTSLSGMTVKDFAGSIANDTGGKRTFKSLPLLDAVPVGTLIVLTNNAISTDIDPSDFVLRLGLADLTYFDSTGTFDLSGTEMVMIKAAGAPITEQEGSVHAFATGDSTLTFTRFENTSPPKLFSNGTNSAIALNPTSSLADFNGSAAAPSATLTAADFGKPNNASNNTYIRQLRGITTLAGAGTATITNTTTGTPFAGKNLFGRNLTGQQLQLTLLSDAAGAPLTQFNITVPSEFGTPAVGSTIIAGPGAGTPQVSVAGQVITVTGTAITTADAVTVTLSGLSTPSPAGASANGRYAFTVRTAGTGESPAPLASSPSAVVIVPIEAVRDVDPVTGLPVDLNQVVAVEGIITEENFNNAQLSAFLQDGAFGLNIFSFNLANFDPLIRGNRYAITGPIIQFAGLTEINPAAGTDVINLGPATPPFPLVLSAAEIATPASPETLEALEGRLVTINGLNYESGTWADPINESGNGSVNNVLLNDGFGNVITVRIAQSTTANDSPAAFPVNVTGILSQEAPAGSPFTGYVLMPRDPDDITAGSAVSGYQVWAQTWPGIGSPSTDADGDGQSNLLEYALGTVPADSTSVQIPALISLLNTPGLSIAKGTAAAGDPTVQYHIEISSDLTTWLRVSDPAAMLEETTNNATTYSVRYLGSAPRIFFRVSIDSL